MSHTPDRARARRLLAATLALATVGLALTAQSPAATALACTIKGTSGPDRLTGTGGNDVICGFGGDDVLVSGGGREDILLGGGGDDRLESGTTTYARLEGGDGHDRLVGGSGKDSLRGGPGRDVLLGGDGADGLFGGGGNDDLDGGAGSDSARWEPGSDTVHGGPGADLMNYYDAPRRVTVTFDGAANDGVAGEGDRIADDVEWVFGSKYADRLVGDGNANRLSGFDGEDLVVGGGGNDRLEGNNEDDEMRGGAGRDRMIGGDGDDLIVGGDGADDLEGAGGNTRSSEDNACDDDAADTVTRCAQDGAAPTFIAHLDTYRVEPGETFTFEEVRVFDDAGVPSVEMVTTLDGSVVPWCSGTMDVVYAGPGGTARVVDKACPVPADAPEGAYEMVFSATDRLGFHGVSSDVRRYGFMVDTTPEIDPPVVVDVAVAKPSYTAGERVRVTITASDPSGVQEVSTLLRPADSGSHFLCPESYSPRTGGTMADGVWSFTCRLSGSPEPGTWSVDLELVDTYGNWAFPPDVATFEVTG